MRASSIFPILSVILLFMGGLCVAASEFYKTRHNIILSAGIFFVSAGSHLRGVWRGGGAAVPIPSTAMVTRDLCPGPPSTFLPPLGKSPRKLTDDKACGYLLSPLPGARKKR